MALTSLYILVSLISLTSGSKILIDANPDVIQSNLTKSMTLRCSLNDTDPVPVSGGVIGKRDTQYTPENVQTLTSIVITRNNGDHVASLITGQQPHAQTDLTNIQVNGSLSLTGEPGEEGYIEVTWNYPQTAQVGEYVCEINAITALGHPVTFKDTVEVIETTPSIGQLIGHVQSLTGVHAATDAKIDQLMTNLTSLENLLHSNAINSKHSETGTISCGDSNRWKIHEKYRGGWPAHYTLRRKDFNVPYTTTPEVKIGVTALDHDNQQYTRYDVTVEQVDTRGFQIKCETWGGPSGTGNSHVYSISVTWMSIGH